MKLVVVDVGNISEGDLQAIAPTWSRETGVISLNSTNEIANLSPMLVNIISSVTGMVIIHFNLSSLKQSVNLQKVLFFEHCVNPFQGNFLHR